MADDDTPPDGEGPVPSYEVGYGKPPKHSQFKEGNKHGKGRPRASRNLSTYVKDALEAKVPAKINGKVHKLTKMELSLHQLANKASSGDLKAIEKATALFERYNPPQNDGPIPEEETAYDLETLRHYFMMQAGTEDE
ncbi:MAG: DUF5681 domain-containing protein [Erythrobacter sp.]